MRSRAENAGVAPRGDVPGIGGDAGGDAEAVQEVMRQLVRIVDRAVKRDQTRGWIYFRVRSNRAMSRITSDTISRRSAGSDSRYAAGVAATAFFTGRAPFRASSRIPLSASGLGEGFWPTGR